MYIIYIEVCAQYTGTTRCLALVNGSLTLTIVCTEQGVAFAAVATLKAAARKILNLIIKAGKRREINIDDANVVSIKNPNEAFLARCVFPAGVHLDVTSLEEFVAVFCRRALTTVGVVVVILGAAEDKPREECEVFDGRTPSNHAACYWVAPPRPRPLFSSAS